jgi:hypothetical protein
LDMVGHGWTWVDIGGHCLFMKRLLFPSGMALCPMSPNVRPNVRVHVLAFSLRNSPVDIDMDMVDMDMDIGHGHGDWTWTWTWRHLDMGHGHVATWTSVGTLDIRNGPVWTLDMDMETFGHGTWTWGHGHLSILWHWDTVETVETNKTNET